LSIDCTFLGLKLVSSFHKSIESQESTPNWLFVTSNKLLQDDPSDLIEIEINDTQLKASRAELAAFELLNSVPLKISFEHAAEVFQGLTSLSSGVLGGVSSHMFFSCS
jgi:hypothetical protein